MTTIQPPAAPAALKNWFARHKVLTVLGIIAVIIIISSIVNSTKKDDAAQPGGGTTAVAGEETAPAKKPGEELPGVGAAVVSGKLEFKITSIDEVGASVGSQYMSTNAQGRFIRVNLRVSNVDKKPKTFIVNYLKIEDDQGRTFEADSSATIYDGANSDTWIAQINPGNAVEGGVIFDLPADATPVSITVSDNAFSGGKKISLAP